MYLPRIIHKTGTYVCLNNSVFLFVEVADFFMYRTKYYFRLTQLDGGCIFNDCRRNV